MLLEGVDADGNMVWMQSVRRGRTHYLRKAPAYAIDMSQRSPRQLYHLAQTILAAHSIRGAKMHGHMPPAAAVVEQEAPGIAQGNPYPYAEEHTVRTQRELYSLLPHDTQDMMRNVGIVPTALKMSAKEAEIPVSIGANRKYRTPISIMGD